MKLSNLNYILGVFMLLFLVACNKKDHCNDKMTLNNIVNAYYEKLMIFYPLSSTQQGETRYNDRLTNTISEDFVKRENGLYDSIQTELKKVDYNALDDDSKIIYDVFQNELDGQLEKNKYPIRYIPFTQFEGLPLDFPMLGSGNGSQPFKTPQDYINWLKRIDAFVTWMDTAMENFKEGIKYQMVLPSKLVKKMIPQMKAEEIITKDLSKNIFYTPIRQFPASFSAADKEKFTQLFRKAIIEKLIPSYTQMGAFLEKEYLPNSRSSDGYNDLPNGDKLYKFYVKYWTTTDMSPQEIHAIGLQEVARIRSEMELIKKESGFKGSLKEFLIKLNLENQVHYKTTGEILAAFNSVQREITPNLKKIFGKIPKTDFEIRQTERFREASAAPEYKVGDLNTRRPGVFYIPIPDPTTFNPAWGIETLFIHEGIPGHHYQISLQQENTSLPKFMRFGWLGAYGEGWALYSETLWPELGLHHNSYQKMKTLSNEMLRTIRLVIDTGIHTGNMNREEGIKYFLANVDVSEGTAIAEIERYMALPGQALSYKIGLMKIQELRKRCEKKMGTKFKLAEFHDELLDQGCLPLNILDRKMTNWANSK